MDNELTNEEYETAFEIELEALQIISEKIKKAFEEERKTKQKYKTSIQPRLSYLKKRKNYCKIHKPSVA
ncbi:MAG: hypothetical protein MUP22_11765 [Desulfobacterales bacterium]|nr:hypothetical protein [Desulfobacterales bacterium]